MKRRKPIFIIHKESLFSMPTRQLLGRLRALQGCEESLLLSDRSSDEALPNDHIIFKETAAWKNAYTDLKQVLAGREHIHRRHE
jgi:hypothetical protein